MFNFNPFGSDDDKRDKRRAFTQSQKKEILHQQNYKCAKCHKQLDLRTVEFDHIKAWSDNGKTTIKNGAALCANCHKLKTHKNTLKKVESKTTKKKESNPLSSALGIKPKSSSRKKAKDPLGLDFNIGLGSAPKKKKKGGKKDSFGFGGIF
ncbi:hypothetical protein CUJ83_00750 [Methanocella sp. CWC-04]|uniref:HNH nuclease domain-containing protein n=1 Tax=Methanooceanicella nereidis TaxID=2052831 RepID=A0AAP2R9S3_9EURY|nr:HNH endonuclease signature motif containing protein [Methanocella sp. CWC-04]MCD1293524.1 hypothetical protein [Methanocella sp. CWC-04]